MTDETLYVFEATMMESPCVWEEEEEEELIEMPESKTLKNDKVSLVCSSLREEGGEEGEKRKSTSLNLEYLCKLSLPTVGKRESSFSAARALEWRKAGGRAFLALLPSRGSHFSITLKGWLGWKMHSFDTASQRGERGVIKWRERERKKRSGSRGELLAS